MSPMMPNDGRLAAIAALAAVFLTLNCHASRANAQDTALAEQLATAGRAEHDPWIILAAAEILRKSQPRPSDSRIEALLSEAERYGGWDRKPVELVANRIRGRALSKSDSQ